MKKLVIKNILIILASILLLLFVVNALTGIINPKVPLEVNLGMIGVLVLCLLVLTLGFKDKGLKS